MPNLFKHILRLVLLLLLPVLARATDELVLSDTSLPLVEREAAKRIARVAYQMFPR
jgi:hypothetical protein